MAAQRRMFLDEFNLLHQGAQRMVILRGWDLVQRPIEGDEPLPDGPPIVTLEDLGLGRLRPVPEPIEEPAEEVDDKWGEDDRSSVEVEGVEVQSILNLDEDDDDGEDDENDEADEADEADEDDEAEAEDNSNSDGEAEPVET